MIKYVFFILVMGLYSCSNTNTVTRLSKDKLSVFSLHVRDTHRKHIRLGEWGYDAGSSTPFIYIWDHSDSLRGWVFDPNAPKSEGFYGSFYMKIPNQCLCDTISKDTIPDSL